MEFKGQILGFKYIIECEDEAEFKVWLEAKLRKYLIKDLDPATEVLLKILGVKDLQDRVLTIEQK